MRFFCRPVRPLLGRSAKLIKPVQKSSVTVLKKQIRHEGLKAVSNRGQICIHLYLQCIPDRCYIQMFRDHIGKALYFSFAVLLISIALVAGMNSCEIIPAKVTSSSKTPCTCVPAMITSPDDTKDNEPYARNGFRSLSPPHRKTVDNIRD